MKGLWGQVALTALAAVGMLLGGCGSPGKPRHRIGSLPFPGPATIYERADPERLGSHRYAPALAAALKPRAEKQRGTLYTCRAGFLDVAHLRVTADWTKYAHDRFLAAVLAGESDASFTGPDGERVRGAITYPPVWDDLGEEARDRVARDGAILAGQRASYLLWTWHEAITWEGYARFIIVSEKGSAFGYDDMVSHAVGIGVAARALRDGRDFDDAMTDHLDAEMDRLGAVDRACYRMALDATKGQWWKNGGPLVRELDAGLSTGRVDPRLVDGLECCQAEAAVLRVPFGPHAGTPSLMPRIEVTIEPRTGAGRRLARAVGTDALAADDIEAVLRHIEAEWEEEIADEE